MQQQRVTPAIALRGEFTHELRDVGAPGLPATLQVLDEWLECWRAQTTWPWSFWWSVAGNDGCGEITANRAMVYAHLASDALNAIAGAAEGADLVPTCTATVAAQRQLLLRLARGWQRCGRRGAMLISRPSATVFLLLLCNDRDILGPWVNAH